MYACWRSMKWAADVYKRQMQEELQAKEYEATAGGGVITAVCGGNRELKSITIDPEAVDPEDVDCLLYTSTAAAPNLNTELCRRFGRKCTHL